MSASPVRSASKKKKARFVGLFLYRYKENRPDSSGLFSFVPFNALAAAALDLLREELLARMGRVHRFDLDALHDGPANAVTSAALGVV